MITRRRRHAGVLYFVRYIWTDLDRFDFTFLAGGDTMSTPLTTAEKASITAIAKDSAGNTDTAAVIAYAIDASGAALLVDNGDGTAEVLAQAAGVAVVTITATDPDGNAIHATEEFDVSAVAGGSTDAVSIDVVVGAPEPQ